MTLIWGLYSGLSSILPLRVSGYCESRGWKRIHDRNRDDFKLKWCETKSTANYSNFREGRRVFFPSEVFALARSRKNGEAIACQRSLRPSAVGPR